jgi:hypothetical protein
LNGGLGDRTGHLNWREQLTHRSHSPNKDRYVTGYSDHKRSPSIRKPIGPDAGIFKYLCHTVGMSSHKPIQMGTRRQQNQHLISTTPSPKRSPPSPALYRNLTSNKLKSHLESIPTNASRGSRKSIGHHACQPAFAIQLSALRPGINIYSPPFKWLKVEMPCILRRAGSAGIVNCPVVSWSPTMGSRSSPRSMKFPRFTHSCCINSIVSKARALIKMKKMPRSPLASSAAVTSGDHFGPKVEDRRMIRWMLGSVRIVSELSRGLRRRI